MVRKDRKGMYPALNVTRKHARLQLAIVAGVEAYTNGSWRKGCPYRSEWRRVAWLRGIGIAASEVGQ